MMIDLNKIWKYLQQQSNDEEVRAVEMWINASKSNEEEFLVIKNIWESADTLDKNIDVEDNWDEFTTLLPEKKYRTRRIMGYAASILLIASIILWFFLPKKIALYESYVAKHDNEVIKLADGSTITLDSASSLKYFTRIDEAFSSRTIYMQGNATFNVEYHDKLPFVVELKETGVEVLGTVFSIEESEGNLTLVENIEGLIKFFELDNIENAIIIEKGQKFSYDGSSFRNASPEESQIVDPRKLYTVEKLIEILFVKFDGKFNTGAYGNFDMYKEVRIDLNSSLKEIILQVEEQCQIDYKKTCPDCFEVNSITFK